MRDLELEVSGGIVFCGVTDVVIIDEDEVRLVAEWKCEVREIRELEIAKDCLCWFWDGGVGENHGDRLVSTIKEEDEK